ncbi:hypothetical protein ABIC83_002464 [Roseateles asaccharophilus]|uniref:hypothetical protein n=1 Tax=Roseateles asaccharophilus TaxID=582607 RepID=UPI0038371D24
MSSTPSVPQLFGLKKMCGNCPFRADCQAIDLAPGRLRSICDDLLANDEQPFFCHKTVDGEHVEAEGGEHHYETGGSERYCVGAMAFLHRERQPNVPMRLGYVFGALKVETLEAVVPQVKNNEEIT